MTFDAGGWAHHQFTADQVQNIIASAVRPIYLIQINHGGTMEYLSCNGAVTFDSQAYEAGGCNLSSMRLYESATLELFASPARAAEVQSFSWRNGACNIWLIPASTTDGNSFNLADAVLLLPGVIDTSAFSTDAVTVGVVNRYMTGVMTPSLTFNQFCSHLPAVGDTLDWGSGDTVNVDPPASIVEDRLVLGRERSLG